MLASGSDDEKDKSHFLSVPTRKADWLRLLLVALLAYVVSIQLFFRFGYTIPVVQQLRFEVVFVYPLVLLAAASVAALFIERRLGIVFSVFSVLVAAATILRPAFLTRLEVPHRARKPRRYQPRLRSSPRAVACPPPSAGPTSG